MKASGGKGRKESSSFEVDRKNGIAGISKSCRSKWHMDRRDLSGRTLRKAWIIGEHYHWSTKVDPASTFVTLRSPANRLRSWVSYYSYGRNRFQVNRFGRNRCEVNLDELKTTSAARQSFDGSLSEFQNYTYLRMISGSMEGGKDRISESCTRLSNAAWVGLTDYYEASICLLHHLYPHAGHPLEHKHLRNTTTFTDLRSCAPWFVEQSAQLLADDEAIYLCGVSRFVEDIRIYAPHCAEFIHTISPYESSASASLLRSVKMSEGSDLVQRREAERGRKGRS